jgi:hypothetical protein
MVGRPVDIHAYAERIMIRQDGASRQNVHAAMAPRNRIRSVDATAHHLTNVDLKLDQGQCHVWTYMDPA